MKFGEIRIPIPPGYAGKVITLETARFFLRSLDTPELLPDVFVGVMDQLEMDQRIAPSKTMLAEIGYAIRKMRKAGLVERTEEQPAEVNTLIVRKTLGTYRVTELGRQKLPAIIEGLSRRLEGGHGIALEP